MGSAEEYTRESINLQKTRRFDGRYRTTEERSIGLVVLVTMLAGRLAATTNGNILSPHRSKFRGNLRPAGAGGCHIGSNWGESMPLPSARDLLDGIRTWVEMESHTADVAGVNRLMDRASADYSAAGAKVERIAGTRGRGDHLLVHSPWGGGAPGVLVLCHLDTVHPKGTISRLPFRVDGDRAYGPGIYDMKGGAHLAFAAFRSLMQAGKETPLPLRFFYASDEEVGSPTSRAIIEREARNAKYVLVTEPCRDGGKIVTARKGVARYVIKAEGKPSHSGSRHEEGQSAILEIAKHVIAIEAMTDYKRGLTFNIGQIHGGTADNTVPQFCEASIDMRIKTMADAVEMEEKLKNLKPYNAEVKIEVSGQLNRPPYEKNAGVTQLFEHAKEVAREIGITLEDIATGGGSDGNFTADRVPTLDGLGVDGNGAHTLDEHLLVSSLVPRMTLQLRLLETLR
jgi:glutamate carboxypeptidase